MAVDTSSEHIDEQAEIAAVIKAETEAFLNRDVEAICNCWSSEPYIQHTTILPYAGMVQITGIDALRAHFLSHFKVYDPLDVDSEAVVRINWQFVIRDNMAWVTFEQVTASDEPTYMSGSQMHTRILEKTYGSWKLVSSTGVLSRLDFYDGPNIHVDGSTKILHASDKTQAFIAHHPVLRISDGHLSAALEKDKLTLRQAIRQAQVQIDNGRARLPEPLLFEKENESDSSLCWIAILDMKIVVLLEDAKLL
ncbi:MAG: hypothetical protein AAF404_16160, partial [Pseudomonadota bacterium]